MSIEDRVRAFVLESFYIPDPEELTDDMSLIDSGIVDFDRMLDVILFVEDEFGIKVLDLETTAENLETISRISAYVTRKQAQAVA